MNHYGRNGPSDYLKLGGANFSTNVDTSVGMSYVSVEKVSDFVPVEGVTVDLANGEIVSVVGLTRFRLRGECAEFPFNAWVVPASALPGVDLMAGATLVREYGRMCRAHLLNPYIHSKVPSQ